MAMGAVALLAFPSYHLPWGLSAALIAGGLGLVIAWWTCPLLVRLLPPGNRVRRQVEHDLAPFWTDRRMLVLSSLVSVVFHLSQVGVQWLLARAAGAPVPFSYCLVMHPVLSVMMALPLSLGGFGVREGGYLWFLRRIGDRRLDRRHHRTSLVADDGAQRHRRGRACSWRRGRRCRACARVRRPTPRRSRAHSGALVGRRPGIYRARP